MDWNNRQAPVLYRLACEAAAPLHPPSDQRIPFGWRAAAAGLAASPPTRLRAMPQTAAAGSPAALRLTCACDVREMKRVRAALAESGKEIGQFDIRYAYALQIFQLPIPEEDLEAALKEGLLLQTVEGQEPFWFFTADDSSGIPETLQPHILCGDGGDAAEAFYRQLASAASVQPFGWLEGCVLDGLTDLDQASSGGVWRSAMEAHLRLFLPDGDHLIYENPRGQPSDHRIYGLEGTLPFAAIARLRPDHPLLDMAVDFWRTIPGKANSSTEGCYTVAYPLAVTARLRGQSDLADTAAGILLKWRDRLASDKGIYLRYHGEGSKEERFYNWARAYAWYMLGFTRSLPELRGLADDGACRAVEEEIRRVAVLALTYQRPDGLWSCFVDDDTTGVDTSGSAGIAAALALGAGRGLLPGDAAAAAERAFEALQGYLTPDGLLTGVAQLNRKGEALQRSGYRVISQMGMGLMGQLAAALGKHPGS